MLRLWIGENEKNILIGRILLEFEDGRERLKDFSNQAKYLGMLKPCTEIVVGNIIPAYDSCIQNVPSH